MEKWLLTKSSYATSVKPKIPQQQQQQQQESLRVLVPRRRLKRPRHRQLHRRQNPRQSRDRLPVSAISDRFNPQTFALGRRIAKVQEWGNGPLTTDPQPGCINYQVVFSRVLRDSISHFSVRRSVHPSQSCLKGV